jgi:predicted SAM-dependent methyltransferase
MRDHDPDNEWINLDATPGDHVDKVAFVPPIPLISNSFDHILASHFLEHVPDTIALMNECHRILKPGGTMEVYVPYAFHHAAYQDPTHVKFFVPESFNYYTEQPFGYLNYGIEMWSECSGWLQPNGWVVEARLVK